MSKNDYLAIHYGQFNYFINYLKDGMGTYQIINKKSYILNENKELLIFYEASSFVPC